MYNFVCTIVAVLALVAATVTAVEVNADTKSAWAAARAASDRAEEMRVRLEAAEEKLHGFMLRSFEAADDSKAALSAAVRAVDRADELAWETEKAAKRAATSAELAKEAADAAFNGGVH